MAENTKLDTQTNFPAAVFNTSIFAAFLLGPLCADETGFEKAAALVADIVKNNGQIFVPQLFWFELGNVLTTACRKRKTDGKSRLSPSDANDIEHDLAQLPIVTDLQPDAEIRLRIRQLALEFNLSFYDAAYLELSRRLQLPLYTLDSQLCG